MGGRQLAGFFAFFIFAGQWLRFVMPPFAKYTAETQRLEADFRSHHHRLIAHSEEIAFYGGSQREKEIVNESFKSVVRISNRHFWLQALMGILDSYLVKYAASMTAYSMMIPAGMTETTLEINISSVVHAVRGTQNKN
jgi:ATP-binding cassette subfamily D (ALD) protein 3